MTDTVINCPNCGHAIPLTEALTAQLRGQLEAGLHAAHEAGLKQAVAEAEARAREQSEKDLKLFQALLAEQRQKARQAQEAELALRREKAALEGRFPRDAIRPVPKGMTGVDLIQEVRDAALKPCGRIVWEVKNTKAWQPGWLAKLKDDQRACGASLAVLVSVALPEEARNGFALIDGVWVASLAAWPALAVALREQLDRERRAMERLWKEREKQLDRIITGTAGMYDERAAPSGRRCSRSRRWSWTMNWSRHRQACRAWKPEPLLRIT
ncbi:MAG: DUF2130 domain-containing protein [Pseudomonadota bacterium]